MIRLFKVFMSDESKNLVSEVLGSGYIGQGPKVDEFESKLRTLYGLDRDVLTLNSCTAALDLSLRLIGVRPGDEVISTPITCTATNSPIEWNYAKVVWADVDPMTGLIDPKDVARKITSRTKAIMAVDWGGKPCDYDELKSFGIPVVEDAAHCLIAKYKGDYIAKTGGDYVCYSYQAIKFLTCVDGGGLVCPEDQVERARLLRWYGLCRRSKADFRCSQDIKEAGFKYHMNDVAAAVGLGNLPYAIENVKKHRENAKLYSENIFNSKIIVPPFVPDADYWIFTILVPNRRQAFIEHMAARGIECSMVHARNDKHTCWRYCKSNLPNATEFDNNQVSIPVGWWLTEEDKARILQAIEDF